MAHFIYHIICSVGPTFSMISLQEEPEYVKITSLAYASTPAQAATLTDSSKTIFVCIPMADLPYGFAYSALSRAGSWEKVKWYLPPGVTTPEDVARKLDLKLC